MSHGCWQASCTAIASSILIRGCLPAAASLLGSSTLPQDYSPRCPVLRLLQLPSLQPQPLLWCVLAILPFLGVAAS